MASLVDIGSSTAQGAAAGGSTGGGWGAAIGGALGALGSIGSSLISSGGSSAAQMLDSLEKYYQPTKAGWSWAKLENQYAIEQYRKQLASSAKADLDLSKQMNMELPFAQVAGLKAAGINPILAVLGSGFSPISSSASASMSGGSHLPSGFTGSSRRVNSAGSAVDFARILGGAIDAEVSNRKADTLNKEALTGNIHEQNDLIKAQAEKTRAEADGIRDKIAHGNSWYSDFGREARSGISPIIEYIVDEGLKLFGFGSPEATKEPNGNSAKNPSVTIQFEKPVKRRDLPSINDEARRVHPQFGFGY